MHDRERFCCVGCGCMMAQDEAQIIFRTGFFKIVHLLGCCKKCHQSAVDPASSRLAECWQHETGAGIDAMPGIAVDPAREADYVPPMIYSIASAF